MESPFLVNPKSKSPTAIARITGDTIRHPIRVKPGLASADILMIDAGNVPIAHIAVNHEALISWARSLQSLMLAPRGVMETPVQVHGGLQ